MADETTDILPHSDDAERAILGAILLDNDHLHAAAAELKPSDFYGVLHRHIFAAVLSLRAQGQASDVITVHNHLKNSPASGLGADGEYLTALQSDAYTSMNVPFYVDIVKEKAKRRELVRSAQSILELARDSAAEDLNAGIAGISQRLHGLTTSDARGGLRPMRAALSATLDRLESEEQSGKSVGLPTGFRDVDALTGGLRPKTLSIVAGRPGMGKTCFGLLAALNVVERGGRVAFFSLEMAMEELSERVLCSRAGVDSQRALNCALQEGDWKRLASVYRDAFWADDLCVDDDGGLTVAQVLARAQRMQHESGGLDLIVVDYLQLLEGADGREDTDYARVSAACRALKRMAMRLNVPVLALAQLSRRVEDRTNRRPRLADLRDSGQLEQDAHWVAFLYREEVYLRQSGTDPGDKEGLAELIVEKNRSGRTGTVKLAFQARYLRFADLAHR